MRPARTARMILVLIVVLCIAEIALSNEPPVADAGLSRYAAANPVRLDGSGSYDPDQSGPLGYTWTQVSGPSVVIAGANTARPTISGFVQTDEIQECEFELVVDDSELTSLPDTVRIVIVPLYGADTLRLENAPFDPNKPTFIYFGGGNCIDGGAGQIWSGLDWAQGANLIGFPGGYTPDGDLVVRTYYKYADMIIVYLSSVAPDYRQPIQTSGWSTGGQPAIDVGLRLNLTYRDARYAVNRVTFLDATVYCRNYSESIQSFLASAVDGEQCWIDNYVGQGNPSALSNVLNVTSALSHTGVPTWYHDSLGMSEANEFNHGVVAGAYWSVVGPGKNLQLAPMAGQTTYRFRWIGGVNGGFMDFVDEFLYPGRLPEPVTLEAWANIVEPSGSVDGVILTCRESENAVGYQLLFGSDPYRIAQYQIVSDTPLPPMNVIRDLASEETWWTIRVRDQHGSTIYADPIRLDSTSLLSLMVENARTGRRYGLIGHAIRDGEPGDTIVLDPGVYEENITFGATPLTVRSVDPNDPVVISGTIIRGRDGDPVVTFLGPQSAARTLIGLTIQSNTIGISCRDAAPTVRNCVLESPDGIAIEYWHGQPPELIDCTILGQTKEGGDLGLVAYWKLDESSGVTVHDSEGDNHGTVEGTPGWRPDGGQIDGAMEFDGACFVTTTLTLDPWSGPLSAHAWVCRGETGQVILSQQMGLKWLMADASQGALKTGLTDGGRSSRPLSSESVITDGDWHRIGFVWDGRNRRLYVDGALVAEDTQDRLQESSTNLILGCDGRMTAGTFWTGLIDDVRIYNRAVRP